MWDLNASILLFSNVLNTDYRAKVKKKAIVYSIVIVFFCLKNYILYFYYLSTLYKVSYRSISNTKLIKKLEYSY